MPGMSSAWWSRKCPISWSIVNSGWSPRRLIPMANGRPALVYSYPPARSANRLIFTGIIGRLPSPCTLFSAASAAFIVRVASLMSSALLTGVPRGTPPPLAGPASSCCGLVVPGPGAVIAGDTLPGADGPFSSSSYGWRRSRETSSPMVRECRLSEGSSRRPDQRLPVVVPGDPGGGRNHCPPYRAVSSLSQQSLFEHFKCSDDLLMPD